MAAQLILMKGPVCRNEYSCSARAMSSLPVPDSPVMSTVERGVRHLLDDGIDLTDGGRISDQPEPAVRGGLLGPGISPRQGMGLHRLLDDLTDLLLVERLLDVVEGPQLD